MASAIALGGFTGPEADTLGYAIRKKKSSVLRSMKDQFVSQAAERGVPAATIDAVFTAFEPFERYGFNKAHATCYGLVAYQTAYLKANYTVEYMTSVLTASRDNAREGRRRDRRVPPAGDRGPAAGHPQLERRVLGRGRRDPVRADRRAQRRPGRDRVDHRRPGRRRVPLADRLLRADRPAPGQQAGPRVAGPGRRPGRVRPPGPDPGRPRRRGERGQRHPARPDQRPGLAVRPGRRRRDPPRRTAAASDRGADPRAAALGEGAPRAVPVGPPAQGDRRGDRPVRQRLLGRPARRVARPAAGRRVRHRHRRPDGDHQGQGDDGDRHDRGPPGLGRGGRLPAPVRDEPADLDRGPDPARVGPGRPQGRGGLAAGRPGDGLGRGRHPRSRLRSPPRSLRSIAAGGAAATASGAGRTATAAAGAGTSPAGRIAALRRRWWPSRSPSGRVVRRPPRRPSRSAPCAGGAALADLPPIDPGEPLSGEFIDLGLDRTRRSTSRPCPTRPATGPRRRPPRRRSRPKPIPARSSTSGSRAERPPNGRWKSCAA